MRFIYSKNKKSQLMRNILTFIAFMIFVTTAAVSVLASPTNDNFLNAEVLTGSGGTFVGTNVDGTKQVGEPYHFGNLGGSSIWYKFVAPGNGVFHFATSNTNFDTVVGVYTGSSVSALTRIASNDNDELDGWMKTYSRVYFGTQAGQTYYIAVDGKNLIDGSGAVEGPIAGNFSFANAAENDNFGSGLWLANGTRTYSITTTNVGASKESGEPNHMNNPGGKSVWFHYANETDSPRRLSITIDSSRYNNPVSKVNALVSVYNGLTLNSLTPVLQPANIAYGKVRLTFLMPANWTYHIAIDGLDTGSGADTGSFTLTYGVSKDNRFTDFDQDGKADYAVFRPTDGNWYSRDSGTNRMRALHWGANGDVPLLGRFSDGDVAYSVFRPDLGVWYETRPGGYASYAWGMAGDIPLIRNWDGGTGIINENPTVFRPSNGTWWTSYGGGGVPYTFGQAGDIPILGDFDGDATDETVVFRPSNGNWYFWNFITNQITSVNFGVSGDIPVPADYNADGILDVAIFRPSTGDWWFRNAQTGAQTAAHFGGAGDIPQPADYDGDGQADLCVFRSGTWWVRESSTNSTKTFKWGLGSDLPVTSPTY